MKVGGFVIQLRHLQRLWTRVSLEVLQAFLLEKEFVADFFVWISTLLNSVTDVFMSAS